MSIGLVRTPLKRRLLNKKNASDSRYQDNLRHRFLYGVTMVDLADHHSSRVRETIGHVSSISKVLTYTAIGLRKKPPCVELFV